MKHIETQTYCIQRGYEDISCLHPNKEQERLGLDPATQGILPVQNLGVGKDHFCVGCIRYNRIIGFKKTDTGYNWSLYGK